MPEAQTIHTERWDHDKAEDMAYLLVTRTEFPDLMDSQQAELVKLETKRQGILQKSIQRGADLLAEGESDPRTLPLRLRAVGIRAILEEVEVDIELIEVRDKQNAKAIKASDELLEEYSRFYDTDTERFAAMTGEEFSEHIQKVDDYSEFISAADEWLLQLRDTIYRTDYYEKEIEKGEKPRIDSAVVNVSSQDFRYALQNLFGKDSEEVSALMEEYKALNDASYETYTPKAIVLALCELNRKWYQFIADSKAAKEAELEALLSAQGSTEPIK